MDITDNYGGFELRKGDNDSIKKWGGGIQPLADGEFVKALQEDLSQLKVYIWKIDGDFGGKTELAVNMFKWNAATIAPRLKDGNIILDTIKLQATQNGIADCAAVKEINRWKNSKFEATGDLVRLDPAKFKAIELGRSFKTISHPDINPGELVVSDILVTFLKKLDTEADNLCLKINLNQALRITGASVGGAVVKPAKKSQHLIGHAIDCNIIDGDNWNNTKTFKNGEESENAKSLITAMKNYGMRWGGDFADKTSEQYDPPHFDKQLDANSKDYEYKYFFTQRTISEQTKIPLKKW